MRTVGMIASVASMAVVLGGVALVVKSLPDIAHYRRLRKM